MNGGLDVASAQPLRQCITVCLNPNGILVIYMLAARTDDRRLNDSCETLCQIRSIGDSSRGELLQFSQLDDAERALKLGHTHIIGQHCVMIARLLSMIAQQSRFLSNSR